MNAIEEYVSNNINDYYKLVVNEWDYTEIDKELVNMVFKEYSKNLVITDLTPHYMDTIVNLYQYALAKVTKFFRDMHIIANSKVNNSFLISNIEQPTPRTFREIVMQLTGNIFNAKLLVETFQIKHISEIFKRGLESIRNKGMLKYVSREDSKVRSKHAEANGITRPAKDPIWDILNSYLGEWNCRCQVISVASTERTKQEEINKINPTKVTDSISEIDYNSPYVKVFKEDAQLFKDYEIIRKTYRKPTK